MLKINDIHDNNVDGDTTFNSDNSTTIGDNFGIDLNTDVLTHDLESIVLYNRRFSDSDKIVGIRMELLNSNDEIVLATNEITQIKYYFRFDGDQIGNASFSNSASTTAVINDSSNTESLTEVADLGTLNYLFSKVRLMRISSPSYFNFRELQLFINGDNKASDTNVGNTTFTTAGVSAGRGVDRIIDDNLSGVIYHSASQSIGDNCGVNFNVYYSKYDIESIVVYNRGQFNDRMIGVTVELLNTNDNVRVSSTEISLSKLHYRFDGPRISDATLSTSDSTTAVINNSSNTETLTEVADLDTLDYLFSKVRLMRISNLKPFHFFELQMFINGVNKASNSYSGNTVFTTAGTYRTNNISRINDGDLTNSMYHSENPNVSSGTIGDNCGVNLNGYFSKYDIESIVIYNRSDGSFYIGRMTGVTIELLNTNDNVRVSSTKISSAKLYYRFDGLRIGDATLSSSASTTAVINDSSNIESLTDVADLGTLNYLFSKVRVIRISNPSYLEALELQMFIEGDNKLFNTNYDPFTTATTHSASGGITMINNNDFSYSNNLMFFSTLNSSVGLSYGVNFNNSYFSKYDIESIVLYSRGLIGYNREAGLRIELLNTNNNIRVSSSEISSEKLYYRFDGPRIGDATLSSSASTTAVINNSSNTESLTEVSDLGTLNYLFSKVRIMRISNPNYFQFQEVQLFINGDNKASNSYSGNTLFTTAGEYSNSYVLDYINDGAFSANDGSSDAGTIYHSALGTSNQAIGNNFGINFNEYFSKYDIESVVLYNRNNNMTGANGVRIELLNANDNVRVSSSVISSGKSYYRFDGDRIGDATLSSSASTIAVIDDSSNTESLSAYSINVITNLSNIVLYLDAANTNSYPGTGTTWTDLSGQSNNGTLINGPTYNSGNGGSLVFDGSNDYVSETSALSDSFFQGNWTISLWVNFDSLNTTNSSNDKILIHHGSSAINKGLHLVQRNSRIHFGLYGNDIQGSATLSTGIWYHVTYTLNNTTFLKQIFINGSLDSSGTGNGGAYTGTGSNTRIGGKVLTFGQYFDGKMSSVIAYSEVLTSSEIANNFDAFKGRYGL